MSEAHPTLLCVGLMKRFGATQALRGVDLLVRPGEAHALVGENGAGKSTLVRIISGVYEADAGVVKLDGEPQDFRKPADAIAAGVITIPQELRLVPAMSVAENIVLGHWPSSWRGLLLRKGAMRDAARDALDRVGVALPLDLSVDRLSFAERQIVAVARALRLNARLLILDEPTAALERREADRLAEIIERLKSDQTGILYVSHKLDEIIRIADRCTVMRDGAIAAVASRGEFDIPYLVETMTGRPLGQSEIRDVAFGQPVLTRQDVTVREREVVGLAGLLGSGARDIVYGVFGAGKPTPVRLRDGAERTFASPAQAHRAGVGLVTGERAAGLVMNMTVADNIVLPSLAASAGRWRLSREKAQAIAAKYIQLLDIRPPRPDAPVSALSGGNQQKVIFAKWLACNIAVMLLDEPTNGVDVAAKEQIHRLVLDFAARGGGVLASSTDTDELLKIADTIIALHEGAVVSQLDRRQGVDEKALRTAIGG